VLLIRRPLLFLFYQPRLTNVEHRWNENWQGKPEIESFLCLPIKVPTMMTYERTEELVQIFLTDAVDGGEW
jgi:hypothetical protein